MATTKVLDFAKITKNFGLKQETILQLNSFRKRHSELVRTVQVLKQQRVTIDFDQYRNVLKNNKQLIDQAESVYKQFVPTKYNLDAHLKIINAYESKAMELAQKTADTVNEELKDLRETLVNIEQARPIDQLTVDDVVRACPDIETEVENRVKLGYWNVDEYHQKFGNARLV